MTGIKIWSKKLTSSTAGGKTKGAFAELGDIKIPNKKGVMHLLGFQFNLAFEAQTAGIPHSILVKIESQDMSVVNEQFALKNTISDTIGTNSQFVAYASEFIELELLRTLFDVSNKTFTISVSVGYNTTTADIAGFVTAIFSNTPVSGLPAEYMVNMRNGFEYKGPALGKVIGDTNLATATAFVDVALTSLEIPAKAETLKGILCSVNPNAGTAGEEVCALITITSGDISDFQPQEWNCCNAWDPFIGTVVGGAALAIDRYYPTFFPLPKSQFTLGAKVQQALAQTVACSYMWGIKYSQYA